MSDPICNVHVHTFNAQYVPDNFVGQFIPVLSKFLTRAFKNKWSSKMVIRILKLMPKQAAIRKYIAFLKVGAKESQYKIYHDLRSKEGYPDGTRFVILPLNFKYMGAGNVAVPYEQQLNDLINVKRSSNKTLLPFLFIDPRMGTKEQNLGFVKKYVEEKGFIGIKLYPALGYYPFDERLDLVYKYAEEKKLPILTHCSSTGVFYNDRKNIPQEFIHPTSFNKQDIDLITNEPRNYVFPFPPPKTKKKKYMQRFADNFLMPVNYTDALEKYKNLKICFAHFGKDNDQHDTNFKVSWHDDITELIKKYPNVYTDISYSLHYKDVRDGFASLMSDKILKSKILYGTDFFMTLQEVESEKELLLKTKDSFGTNFIVIARDNIRTYLSSEVYTY